ncbi:hypothetical protein DMB66_26520 [Actinoplanes sp. ATCC 53533]|uniref:DUF2264 domain-containing protein n=1 Tax=Actinoplanes sp. ATCC 53533 TaxID=1288362 RepID=UPI000F77DB8E|nr:DUF2264 domain-containing protein [Actinoplanes sp. ATCC 53533]RSM59807.1 hypothetical protein DMB66_26520 [Actinoplanes sp. ATCC 53533]
MTNVLTSGPPLDAWLSPHTGWTRAHWESAADHLLDAVVPFAAPGFAQVRLPGRPGGAGLESDGLEGYARTFLLAAFRIAGAGGDVPAALIERYADGLAHGTDPGHRYAWPAPADCSQQIVEAASIALALHETRPWLFDRLDPRVRERVVGWLAGFTGKRTWQSNWVLFPVVIQQFLANVGAPHDPAGIAGGLERIEQWYVGDGWYTDGDGRCFDYYAGWAMHLYPMMWARMSGDRDRADRYRERLRAFLTQYQHMFARDGAPVHQGRSLCYRFAGVAPLWLGELMDASPLPAGRTRRIASGVLRHFAERGVPDERGLLGLGWYERFLPCTQPYSGPASPYWASKAFLGLLLPADHPTWTVREATAPIDEGDRVVAMPGPGWLLHATRHDGIVRVVNHGSDRARHLAADGLEDPHYTRFGYASHAAPESGEEARVRAVDGHLAVVAPDGTISRRRRIEPIAAYDRFAASAYEDELPGGPVRVETASVVRGPWEVRVHRVTAPPGHGVREGGYALAGDRPPAVHIGPGWARASRPDGLASVVVTLHGFGAAAVAGAVDANAYGVCSATPYLTAPGHPGGSAVYVSLIALTGDRVVPGALRESVMATVDGDTVGVRFPDGERVEVVLGAEPAYARYPVAGAPVHWPPA